MSPHSNLAYIQRSIRCDSATPAQNFYLNPFKAAAPTFGVEAIGAPARDLALNTECHSCSEICLRGEAKRTDAVVAASRTAGQLSAYCLSRVPDLSHCLRQALLGHAELVGPVLDLMGFQEADARPVCRSSLVRIVCHGWLPFRGNCSITEFVPYSSPFMLHRNSPLVGGMEQIRLSRDLRWAEPCASKEAARTTNPGRGMNGGR
jgi:hypothetical protein